MEHPLHNKQDVDTSDIFINEADPTLKSDTRLDPSGRPLVPTPTTDQYDPLNWPTSQKYICVFIVIYSYFMLTYFTTVTIPSFTSLESQLSVNYSQVNWTFAIPCLGLALGPLLVGALADTYGRRPVLIVSTALAVVASGCTAIKGINFGGYMAARFFQGLGAGPAANVGLVIINDVSWEHERGTRVGMWTIAANSGTVVGGVCESIDRNILCVWDQSDEDPQSEVCSPRPVYGYPTT